MSKKENLNTIVKNCQLRFDRGDASAWKHSDYNDLSREILRDTKIAISYNTLKRIFGKVSVDEDYKPQQATYDALLQYGSKIIKFVESPIEDSSAEKVTDSNIQIVENNNSKISNTIKAALTISLLALAIIATVVLVKLNRSTCSIKVVSTEGVLPATVLFKLSIPKTKDSIFVDFGDKSANTYVQTSDTTIAHNFLIPGVFNIILASKNHVFAKTITTVQSNQWIGLGFHRQVDLPEHYYEVPATKSGTDNIFHITNQNLHEHGIDTSSSYYTRLCYFRPVAGKTENFVFETKIKTISTLKGMHCSSTQFQISGLRNVIRFKFSSPGCTYRITNIISEKKFQGSKTDLSQFALNLNSWNTIRLMNKDKNLSLTVNDKPVFSGSYKESLGQIQGVTLEFEGDGYVKTCMLRSLTGKTIYKF